MNSTDLGRLIYSKIFNITKQPIYPCNLSLGNVILDYIKADSKLGCIFHTKRNHGIPLSFLDRNEEYLKIITNYINKI